MKRVSIIVTSVLAGLTLLVLALSMPDSLRDDLQHHNLYVFSRAFIQDIPKRMSGPGRFRLILQPLVPSFLGIRGGIADARVGRPPFLTALVLHRELRGKLLRNAFRTLVNLLLMSVLLDSLLQWLIYGISHPGAALIVGPFLIAVPYLLARAFANHAVRLRTSGPTGGTCNTDETRL